VDRYGGKFDGLFMLPIIALIVALGVVLIGAGFLQSDGVVFATIGGSLAAVVGRSSTPTLSGARTPERLSTRVHQSATAGNRDILVGRLSSTHRDQPVCYPR
jgi:uncharacterized membrane protein YoaK (UPF0700 family)